MKDPRVVRRMAMAAEQTSGCGRAQGTRMMVLGIWIYRIGKVMA